MPGVRFAPSPTGRFHVGNLRTAWISHWIARSLRQPWVVRFEDIDRPRVASGAREEQLRDLAALGLMPDRTYDQWDRRARHYEWFVRARAADSVYPCVCSRKDVQEALAASASAPHFAESVYNGKCRAATVKSSSSSVAWRIRGTLENGSQDFIVARTPALEFDPESFIPGYHWACAIDDRDGAYALLVRAWDLEPAVAQQRAVHSLVDRLEGKRHSVFPAVFHCALVTRDDGGRLEKRTAGVTLAEIQSRGIDIERLIAMFGASFDPSEATALTPARSWGESRPTLTVSSLGL